jgi:hypothetical protein
MEQFCTELEQLSADLNNIELKSRHTLFLKAHIAALIECIKRNNVTTFLYDRPCYLLYVSYDELKNIILGKNGNKYYYLKCRYFTIMDQFDIKIVIKN